MRTSICALLEAGYEVAVLDSLVHSSSAAIDAVGEIAGRRPPPRIDRGGSRGHSRQ